MAKFEIKDGVAIIPEGTTEIEDCAFQDCSRLLLLAVFSDAPRDRPTRLCASLKNELLITYK
jgi:hypothetical protein